MTTLNFNPAQAGIAPSTGAVVLPKDWYTLVCTSDEVVDISDNRGRLLKQMWSVVDGPHKGAKIFVNLNLWHINEDTAKSAWSDIAAQMAALGMTQLNDTREMHNRPLRALVGVKAASGGYEESNRVRAWRRMDDPTAVSTAPAPMPGPGGFPAFGGIPGAVAVPPAPPAPQAQPAFPGVQPGFPQQAAPAFPGVQAQPQMQPAFPAPGQFPQPGQLAQPSSGFPPPQAAPVQDSNIGGQGVPGAWQAPQQAAALPQAAQVPYTAPQQAAPAGMGHAAAQAAAQAGGAPNLPPPWGAPQA